jgi:vacuolar-type H+-ATPase subunit C/Vma6
MTSRARIAFGYARMRAWRSRLLTRDEAATLFAAPDARAMHRALAALGIERPMERLLVIARTALRDYAHGAPLFRALLALHEGENVKLLWRVAVAGAHGDRIARLWIDLRDLATVPMVEVTTPARLAETLARTPFGEIAALIARVHAHDAAAAELAIDRWLTRQLRDAAEALPRDETLARSLVATVTGEREAQLAMRGARWFGLASVEPQRIDVAAIRAERARLCRRAFAGDPFTLAIPLAVLLLAEAEVRAVRALVERQGQEAPDGALDEALARALAGSRIGE